MISPGFIGTSSRASEDLHEQIINLTDSSMCSLLKSSDNDFTTSDADEDEKDCAPPRPTLPDPFWLTAVDFTPQLTLGYQIKLKNLTDVLKRDHDFLKKMTQPNQVKEQLAQLYKELEETGEAIKPLLEAELTTSSTSSSSYSTGEECEEIYINTQKQRQVRFERYAIIYGEDAPMPPSLKNPATRKDEESSSGANVATNKNKSSKNSPEDSSSSLSSTGQSTQSSNDRQKTSSTSLGSSSAISVGFRPSSGEDDNKGSGNSRSPKVATSENKAENPNEQCPTVNTEADSSSPNKMDESEKIEATNANKVDEVDKTENEDK